MGTSAPDSFLCCDGAVYNISEYPGLVNHFKHHFGSSNYFGGNGSTTFAVPNLRGEFLRGYGTKGYGSSGIIGKHQDATQIPKVWIYGPTGTTKNLYVFETSARGQSNDISNPDIKYGESNNIRVNLDGPSSEWLQRDASAFFAYTTRPTNVAVLYCIRYK